MHANLVRLVARVRDGISNELVVLFSSPAPSPRPTTRRLFLFLLLIIIILVLVLELERLQITDHLERFARVQQTDQVSVLVLHLLVLLEAQLALAIKDAEMRQMWTVRGERSIYGVHVDRVRIGAGLAQL